MASALGSRFSTDPVSSFPFKGSVIEINSKTRVNAAFRTLIQNNLLSAPVYDEELKKYVYRIFEKWDETNKQFSNIYKIKISRLL